MSFNQIKNKYIATFQRKQMDLQAAWDKKNIEQLHDLLHKLTGSSGGYGFTELCRFCSQAALLTNDPEDFNKVKIESCLKKISTILINENNKLKQETLIDF